jgi:hypothetical protein
MSAIVEFILGMILFALAAMMLLWFGVRLVCA